MVFSSIPAYLDPPNWPQQLNHQPGAGGENPQLLPPQTLPPNGSSGGGGSTGSIRPGSMAERARLAKIPQSEAALKCPRCESTNTKFCYFNNYSLSQPRHFCKTCRRYWTRGGALRNVPVGGGCRRNKRSKGSSGRSKSPVKAAGSSSSSGLASNICTTDIVGNMAPPPQLPIFPPLHHVGDYSSTGIGSSFCGIQPSVAATGGGGMEFQIACTSSNCGSGSILPGGFVEQWRLQQQVQQFPFLSNLEPPPTGLYQFEGDGVEHPNYIGHLRSNKPLDSVVTQLPTVKMEETQGLSLSRNFFGIPGNDQYWGGNAWTDLPGFTSSSTSHLL